MKKIVEVAVGLPVPRTFHYLVPERMRDSLQVGMRVLVPFKGRKVTGFALDLQECPPEGIEEKLKEIEELLDEFPLIGPQMLRFYRWVADYYLHPLGEVIKTGLPPGLHLKSEMMLTRTEEGGKELEKGDSDSLEARVLGEIPACGEISMKRILSLYQGEVSRSQLLLWARKGLLRIGAGWGKGEIKPKIEKVIEVQETRTDRPLSKKQAEILEWLSERKKVFLRELTRRFHSPLKAILSLQEKGCITISCQEVCRPLSIRPELISYPKPELTDGQEKVFQEMLKGIHSRKFSPFLLHGVTGSGKTEIYLRVIEEVLMQGREAIALVPEISLTPQLFSRFEGRFGGNLSLLHSGLGRGERVDQWRRILRSEVKIVLGARSAIFAPFKNVGVIIVDEEHDPSYKQEEKLKYHARDLAVVRAKQDEAVLLLGSATPSLESFHNAEQGKFRLLSLPDRIEGRPLPEVEIVDMKGREGNLSDELKAALEKNLREKRQSLIFLNRRGFATFIFCPECGFTFHCPNCSVTLTHHLRDRSLQCHYCDYRIQAPGDCPRCEGHRLKGMGAGTERLEEEIRALFPEMRIGRMDRDTTTRKHAHQQILKGVETGKIDLLLGTQMVVKGHDFPNIGFVGVVSADTSLHFPDFRSSERTFQLLTQVAGRAGRGDLRGEVVIQTFHPDHYSIQRAKDHDFPGFYREEIQFRKALEYPPFSRIVNFRVTGNSEKGTQNVAEAMGGIGEALLKKGYQKGIELLGPSTAPFAKMRGKFRWQMLAKGKSPRLLHQFAVQLSHLLEKKTKGTGVNLDIDVDPIFIL